MRQAARHSAANAHYLCESLEKIGMKRKYTGEFFHEFVMVSSTDSEKILRALEEQGYLGGLPLSSHEILWCATEKNTKEEIDRLIEIIKEACGI